MPKRLPPVRVVSYDQDNFLPDIPAQACWDSADGWEGVIPDQIVEGEVLPGPQHHWWASDGSPSATTARKYPEFADYWEHVVMRYGRFDEIFWLYELQARFDGRYAFGKPSCALSYDGISRLMQIGADCYWDQNSWRAFSRGSLVRHHGWSFGGWSDLGMTLPKDSTVYGPVRPVCVNLDAGEWAIRKELLEFGMKPNVRKFRAWLKRQREKHKITGPGRGITKGQARKVYPWRFVEALDERKERKVPSRTLIRRAFDYYGKRLWGWAGWPDFSTLPEYVGYEFEDAFKEALYDSEARKRELKSGV